MSAMVIAIDGPSGTGKSTVARAVARALGLAYLDTGAMYRVAALWCMREGIRLTDEDDVLAGVTTMNVAMGMDPASPQVTLDGEDVTTLIRSDAVALAVSDVATNLQARAWLGQWQRELIAAESAPGSQVSGGRGVVAEGRDITTVIAPDADVRVLMVADPDVRVARRAAEGADEATVRQAVVGRDARDSTVVNFHEAADGVVTLDTSELTIDEAVAVVLRLAHEAAL